MWIGMAMGMWEVNIIRKGKVGDGEIGKGGRTARHMIYVTYE